MVRPMAAEVVSESSSSNLLSIAELRNLVTEQGRVIESFKISGIVRAVVREKNAVALQDATSTALLVLPSVDAKLKIGDRLEIQSDHCALTRNRLGIQIGTAPVLDNVGLRYSVLKSGKVFLEEGLQPFCLTCYNRWGWGNLSLEYEGPGISPQKIPAHALGRATKGADGQTVFQNGLDFVSYNGTEWPEWPDLNKLIPVTEGVATNIDVSSSVRTNETLLVFRGYLKTPATGIYTFYLGSDDRCRLDIGKQTVSCKIIPQTQPAPTPTSFEQALTDGIDHQWVEAEGEVVFAGMSRLGLEIELVEGERRIPVTIVEGTALTSTNLLHSRIRVDGISEHLRDQDGRSMAGIIVPGSEQVWNSIAGAGDAGGATTDRVLTSIGEVRRLSPEQAGAHIPARLKGVIIFAEADSVVLEDSSGGVYIHLSAEQWADQPTVGEYWEITGTTDPGDFSPVIFANNATFLGSAAPPEPIRPTWDQLMNGSLDAQYVEVRGALTSISDTQMTLLTPDGKLTVVGDYQRPLPQLPAHVPSGGSMVGSVVRLRGCFTTLWSPQTRQVVSPGAFKLYPAQVEVEEPPPADPFSLPTRKVEDLLWFNAGASALQRTKLAGQIIYVRDGQYFAQGDSTGFHILTDEPVTLKRGDMVEAVGFPQLGGASPVLLEAQIRKTGAAALPVPVRVASTNLLGRKLDSTLVEVEAMLVSDVINRSQRILELQAGPYHFLARMDAVWLAWGPFAAGTRLRLTGVYTSVAEDRNNGSLDSFELLLYNPADIVVLQTPSWWTVRHTVAVIAILALGLGLALVWITLLRQKVEERTAQLQKEIEERQLAQQHRAIDQERTRVAQDLHDELGAGLTEVNILGSLAKTPAVPPETKERYIDQLTNVARTLVTTLDEIVWAVNPHYDSVASLATYYSLFAQRFLNVAGIGCRLRVSETIPEHALDSKIRHDVFRAFKEALNNVVRHSGATEVRLVIEVSGEQLLLAVVDNGRGFDPGHQQSGADGLTGMSRRMDALGGSCKIVSQPGQGTTIELRLPLKKGNNHD